ncbi:MAG: rRNA maturation RNase YbeY [Cyclobacteriaceae bacterium]
MPAISFDSQQADYILDKIALKEKWLHTVAKKEDYYIKSLSFSFLSDDGLLAINKQFLQHDYYTDIITFDQGTTDTLVVGDIFISIDRIKDNAKEFNTSFEHELIRVMSHGLFHLCGYGDKTEEEASLMREKEESAIDLYPF